MDASDLARAKMMLTVLATGTAFISCLRIPHKVGSLYAPLTLLLGLALFTESVGLVTAVQGIGNNGLYNCYLLMEFLLWLVILFRYQPRWRLPLGLTATTGMVAWAANLLVRRNMEFLFTPAFVVMYVLLTIALLAVLWRMADHSKTPLHRMPEFWLFLGQLMFTGASAPMLGPLEYLYGNYPQLTRNLYTIIALLGYLRYALTAKACIMERRNRSLGLEESN